MQSHWSPATLLLLLAQACATGEDRLLVDVDSAGTSSAAGDGGSGGTGDGGSGGTGDGGSGGSAGATSPVDNEADCYNLEIAYFSESYYAAGCDPYAVDQGLSCAMLMPYQLGCDCWAPVNPDNGPEITVLNLLQREFDALGCTPFFDCFDCGTTFPIDYVCEELTDGLSIGSGYSGICVETY